MKTQILTRGPWQVPYKATNVLCEDGVRRTARITREPDTFFSIPATVQARGKTVTGFVTSRGDDLIFIAYAYGKNHAILDGEK